MDREALYDTIPEYAERVDFHGANDTAEGLASRGYNDSGRFGSVIEPVLEFNSFPDQLDLVPA